jgi:lipopolysaccharide transport system ATP-binding protein
MTKPVIKVENLSKQYRLGATQGYKTCREASVKAAKAPFRNFGKSNPQSAIDSAAFDKLRPRASRGELAADRNPQSDTIWALKDVSFEVSQGEVVGIIGRNGAGKSTLLKVLSKITEPTEGRVELRDRIGSLLEVGTGFHPELTGHENIYLYGAILGMDRWEVTRKFDEIVAFAEIEKFIDTPVKRYSSGMYMRLAFAVAAHLDPEILLIDEVLSVGDASFQKKCMGKMEDASQEGRTVLFVSHNMTAVQSLCDRCILIDKGKVFFDGDTTKAIDRYLISSQSADVRNTPGEYDLAKRDNSYLSSGDLIIQKLRLLDSKGNLKDTFAMGEEMQIEVSVNGLSDYRDALIGIIYKTNNEQRITSISTGMTCSSIEEPRHKLEQATLIVPDLPLMPGNYWIDVSAAQQGIAMLDYVDRAANFNVIEADVYDTGYRVTSNFGLVYLKGDWKIKRLD